MKKGQSVERENWMEKEAMYVWVKRRSSVIV